MPIYEFKCAACDKKFEELCSSATRPEDLSCPSCGGHDLKKCFSSFGFSPSGAGGPSLGSAFNAPSSGGGCASCSTRSCSTCH